MSIILSFNYGFSSNLQLMKLLECFADMFKHPTHPITPSVNFMAASSFKNTNTVDSSNASSSYVQLMELLEGKPELLEGNAKIQDVLVNGDAGDW